jgi:hypothetical protein
MNLIKTSMTRCGHSTTLKDTGHQRAGEGWDIFIHWEDGSNMWDPLGLIHKSDPVTIAQLAPNH